jgi:hypothetical protein
MDPLSSFETSETMAFFIGFITPSGYRNLGEVCASVEQYRLIAKCCFKISCSKIFPPERGRVYEVCVPDIDASNAF